MQQMKILGSMAKALTPQRAKDGLAQKMILRMMKAFNYQPSNMHPLIFDLIQRHLKLGEYQVSVPTIISMIESNQGEMQEMGMKIMTVLSDANKVT